MAHYFFHLRNGAETLLDGEGRDLDGDAAIAAAALREARAIISHEILGGFADLDQNIDVQDEAGAVVHSLAFTDAIDINRPQG